jgi:uncharacterized protein
MTDSSSSPCTQICTIDTATRLCLGCGRSIDEISVWYRLSETERHAIMATLPARMAGHGLAAPAGAALTAAG